MALIIGSAFYGTLDATTDFFSGGPVLFMTVFLNALGAITEIKSLDNQPSIVEKHAPYAFDHPATEARNMCMYGLADTCKNAPIQNNFPLN